jgi:hypothetical protein
MDIAQCFDAGRHVEDGMAHFRAWTQRVDVGGETQSYPGCARRASLSVRAATAKCSRLLAGNDFSRCANVVVRTVRNSSTRCAPCSERHTRHARRSWGSGRRSISSRCWSRSTRPVILVLSHRNRSARSPWVRSWLATNVSTWACCGVSPMALLAVALICSTTQLNSSSAAARSRPRAVGPSLSTLLDTV